MPKLSDEAAILYQLDSKEKEFVFDDAHKRSFDIIKNMISNESLLTAFDANLYITVWTDASQRAMCGVLTQGQSPGHFFTSYHRKFNPTECRYSATERELLAVTETIRKNRIYLWGSEFCVKTDHDALRGIFTKYRMGMIHENGRIQNLLDNVGEFNFPVEFVEGIKNKLADFGTR
ncbi:unnamed protein product, partial [Heterosigma akashiwo]